MRESKLTDLCVINTDEWLQEHEASFAPPVCNKLMHNGQLIVMFVGGPNERDDYHIEEGEELFYQLRGSMCVRITEAATTTSTASTPEQQQQQRIGRDVHIGAGELFVLPARVPHSPQRTAGTIGLVIERRRLADERDAVRWHVAREAATSSTLYERWFACRDLGTELGPLIREYFASDEYRTRQPSGNVLPADQMPYALSTTAIDREQCGPYDLALRLASEAVCADDKQRTAEKSGSQAVELSPVGSQFEVRVVRNGEHRVSASDRLDTFMWQISGSSRLRLAVDLSSGESDTRYIELHTHDSLLLPAEWRVSAHIVCATVADQLMTVRQDPERKQC